VQGRPSGARTPRCANPPTVPPLQLLSAAAVRLTWVCNVERCVTRRCIGRHAPLVRTGVHIGSRHSGPQARSQGVRPLQRGASCRPFQGKGRAACNPSTHADWIHEENGIALASDVIRRDLVQPVVFRRRIVLGVQRERGPCRCPNTHGRPTADRVARTLMEAYLNGCVTCAQPTTRVRCLPARECSTKNADARERNSNLFIPCMYTVSG
jgi:hypothetical protein